MSDQAPEVENPFGLGFDFQGRYYALTCSQKGKDLMLIDRISGMGIIEFFHLLDEPHALARAGILLTLFATSLRAGNPDWSVERIVALVTNADISEFQLVAGADEDEPQEEPSDPLEQQPPATDGESSKSQSNGSSSLLTLPESSASEMSSETPR